MAQYPVEFEIKVYRYDVAEDYTREKLYTQVDITDSVQQPITRVKRTDTALDTASIVIINKDDQPLKPFTRIRIIYNTNNGLTASTENEYWIVEQDVVDIAKYSPNESERAYKHQVSLIEPTKWLERFDVDNTTITNMLMFLYQDAGVSGIEVAPIVTTGGSPHINLTNRVTSSYTGFTPIGKNPISPVSNTSGDIDCSQRVSPTIVFKVFGLIPIYKQASLSSYKVQKPDGTYDTLSNSATSYTATTDGTYKFIQLYTLSEYGCNWEITYTWEIKYSTLTQITGKEPQRKTIADVIDIVLNRVTRENSIKLQSQDSQFQLDSMQRERLAGLVAPEFTFTQSTLFDILLQIGMSIHAIPRLILEDGDTDGNIWNTIHFDFLGSPESATDVGRINYEITQRSDNYATAFVSNVQNAFVSSNTAYISITEPFGDGYISTRTESGDYEVSEDTAVIKVSRPIQRITEIQCLYDINREPIDIAPYCKEKTDYQLLTDYEYADAQTNYGSGTKQTAIYFTRGDSVIRGLSYQRTPHLSVTTFGQYRTITYILAIAISLKDNISWSDALDRVKNIKLKNLMFRIKYVPYLSFKMKQFRDVVEDEMETSTLFFNQNGQQVDINAFGERIKAALNMTANKEPTMTFVSRLPSSVHERTNLWLQFIGSRDQYIPYEVRQEISKKSTTTTIVYSKDFNKWNEYDAIRKNYREWEISENEAVEQNPIYNQFCLISDEVDIDQVNEIDTSQMTAQEIHDLSASVYQYSQKLKAKEGFMQAANKIMQSIFEVFSQVNLSIEWIIAKFKGLEWSAADGLYNEISHMAFFPTTAVAVGNAIVLNIATKDNYSAGTTTEEPASLNSNYSLEVDIPYGTKYGTAETMQLWAGHNQFDTQVTSANLLAQAKQLCLIPNNFDFDNHLKNDVIKIVNDPLVINKDSRQQLNLTMQLNFVSEKDYIWISSKLPAYSSFIGTEGDGVRVVYFRRKPSRFFNEELTEGIDYEFPAVRTPLSYVLGVVPYSTTILGGTYSNLATYEVHPYINGTSPIDAVGWGLIDNNNNLLLYYNKAVETGHGATTLYFQFRDRI